MILGREELRRVVRGTAYRAPARELFTCIDARDLFDRERHGIDALLTDPALVREALCYGDPRVLSEGRRERADAVWDVLFAKRSPVSDAAQAVLFSLKRLGHSPSVHGLSAAREQAALHSAEARVLGVLDAANLCALMVRVDLFDDQTAPFSAFDERLRASIALDSLQNQLAAWPKLAQRGCKGYQDTRDLILRQAERHGAESLCAEQPSEGAFFAECAHAAADRLGVPILYASDASGPPDAAMLLSRIRREGLSFAPYASGARVLEQLPGRWEQARRAVATALTDAYAGLSRTGWQLSSGEIAHDIEQFMAASRLFPAKKRESVFTNRMDIVHKQEVL